MSNQITRHYGRWLNHLKILESKIKEETEDSSSEDIIIDGLFKGTKFSEADFKIDFNEFRKIAAASFKQTKCDHGNTINDTWESSYFKRLWGQLKHLRNLKLQTLKKYQLEQIEYLRKATENGTA